MFTFVLQNYILFFLKIMIPQLRNWLKEGVPILHVGAMGLVPGTIWFFRHHWEGFLSIKLENFPESNIGYDS